MLKNYEDVKIFQTFFLLVKIEAPSFQKEVLNIFLSQILTDWKKKIWSLPFQPLLDFPGWANNNFGLF
jgi:hypothetical protein